MPTHLQRLEETLHERFDDRLRFETQKRVCLRRTGCRRATLVDSATAVVPVPLVVVKVAAETNARCSSCFGALVRLLLVARDERGDGDRELWKQRRDRRRVANRKL